MSLSFAARHRLGDFELDAAFDAGPGVTALFGKSGSGKSTIVKIIAGLIRPRSGLVHVDGQVLTDTASGRFVPVHRRRVGYVFQEDRLFPHLNVRHNLSYAIGAKGGEFSGIVEKLNLGHLLDRDVGNLSGGERQRVSVGRALLSRPRILLMDEPLSSLDQGHKAEIVPFLESFRKISSVPVVYVTHALEEVAQFADHIALTANGRIRAAGTAAEIFSRGDLAREFGLFEAGSVLTTRVVAHDPAGGLSHLAHPSGQMWVPLLAAAVGSEARVRVRARDIVLGIGDVSGLSARNCLDCTVTALEPGDPPHIDIRLDAHGTTLLAWVTRDAANDLKLAPGLRVKALFKAVAFTKPGDPPQSAMLSP